MGRHSKLLIKPCLLGLVVAVGIGFALSTLWGELFINAEILNPAVYDRAMQDRVYHDRVMDEVGEGTTKILMTVAVFAWIASATWFIVCWKTAVSEVGAPRHLRSLWVVSALVGLLIGLVASSYFAFIGSTLASVVTLSPRLYTVVFVGPYFVVIVYATSVLCTHPVYLPAIPFSRWRPW